MNSIEIKKELYRQKPTAKFIYIRKGFAYYETSLEVDGSSKRVIFEVPVSDMGDADFTPEIDAQHLNRWILN